MEYRGVKPKPKPKPKSRPRQIWKVDIIVAPIAAARPCAAGKPSWKIQSMKIGSGLSIFGVTDMMTLKHRPACADDKEIIYQINCAAYRDIVTAQFGKWDEVFQRDHFEKKWDPARYSVLTIEEQVVGCMAIENYSDHIFLSEIQVEPTYQGRGYGTAVLRDLLAEAKQKNLPVRLRVLKLSRAVGLYTRLGFIRTSENDTHFYMEWRNSQ